MLCGALDPGELAARAEATLGDDAAEEEEEEEDTEYSYADILEEAAAPAPA